MCLGPQNKSSRVRRQTPLLVVWPTSDIVVIHGFNWTEKERFKEKHALTKQSQRLCSDWSLLSIYTNFIVKSNFVINLARLRATPNYCKTGPWYDFVNVKWDENPPRLYPARCLAFYKKRNSDNESVQIMALIHGADKYKGHASSLFTDTLLTSHHVFEYTSTKKPKIYAIPVASIESAVMCFYHQPSKDKNTLFDATHNGFMMIRPRNEWAYVSDDNTRQPWTCIFRPPYLYHLILEASLLLFLAEWSRLQMTRNHCTH